MFKVIKIIVYDISKFVVLRIIVLVFFRFVNI